MTDTMRERIAKAIYDELEGPVNNQDYGRQEAQWEQSLRLADAVSRAVGNDADEIERLREALEGLLCEAEDVFNCMADATGIDRHNYPPAYQAARAALARRGTDD